MRSNGTPNRSPGFYNNYRLLFCICLLCHFHKTGRVTNILCVYCYYFSCIIINQIFKNIAFINYGFIPNRNKF